MIFRKPSWCYRRRDRSQVPALTGQIEDCHCDVETVDQINTRHFLPILHDLTKRLGGSQ